MVVKGKHGWPGWPGGMVGLVNRIAYLDCLPGGLMEIPYQPKHENPGLFQIHHCKYHCRICFMIT